MVGYTALLDPVAGRGARVRDAPERRGRQASGRRRAALAAVRAGLAGRSAARRRGPRPPPPTIPDSGPLRRAPTSATTAARSSWSAEDDGLSISIGLGVRPPRARSACDASRARRSSSPIRRSSGSRSSSGATTRGRVVEAFHGGTWFRGERYEGPEPPGAARRRGAGTRVSTATTTRGARCCGSSLRKGRLAITWPADATTRRAASSSRSTTGRSRSATRRSRDASASRGTSAG